MIMRKHFLLFLAAFCSVVAVNANTYTLEPGVDRIKGLIDAGTLADGDVIELQTGNYTEWNSLTFSTKVTIQAAEGAKPKLALVYFVIQNDFEINGIEISNSSKDNYLFRVYADVAGTVAFKNCSMQLNEEVTNPVSYINVKEGKTVGSLVVENCLFKPNAKTQGAVIGASGSTTTITNFSMINSTAYNCGNELTVWLEGVVNANVDHCTFYNCGTRVLYLKGNPISTCSISNSVIANPAEATGEVVVPYTGTVSNFVYYNTSEGVNWQATKVNVTKADPLFVDPANGDFNFAFTSPLFLAATDGTHIGDPRWGVEEPETAIGVPGTLPVMDAVLQGTKISKSEEGIKWNDNSANPDDNTASWVIDVAKAGTYEVVINSATTATAHKYRVCLASVNAWLDVKAEPEHLWKEGDFSIGTFTIPEAGTYMIRMMNEQVNSSTEVKSLTMNYLGGSVVNLPGILPSQDAILGGNDEVKVDEEGYICFSGDDNVPNCFAKWNANFTKKGEFGVSINVATTNGHKYKVQVLKGEAVVGEAEEPSQVETQGEIILKGNIKLQEAGTYTIKLINQTAHSNARVKDITFTYSGGAVVNIPATLLPADAILSEKAFVDNDTILFAPRGAEGLTPDGWAKWNVRLENDAICAFTAKCYVFNDNGSTFQIKVFNAENEVVYQKSKEIRKLEDIEVEINLESTLLPAGDYVIQMQNTVKHSKGRLMSVVVEGSPVLVITDDSDIDFTAYAGQTVNVQLQRTFKANMYNPICLPFGVDHSVLQSILKCETSYLLKSSSLEGQKLYVELEASQHKDIYNGSPYMIKPLEDVVYPLFTNVTIMETPYATSSEKGVLKLQGSFIKQTIDNHQNALLVGANNTLFFPSDGTPYIKSMRAYFILVGQAAGAPIKAACFREPGNAPTEMIIVGGEAERQKGHRKVLVDGQIRIQHEGKCYSILGLER